MTAARAALGALGDHDPPTARLMIDAGAPNVAAAISDWIVAIDRTRPLLRKHVLLSLFSQARLARATAQ